LDFAAVAFALVVVAFAFAFAFAFALGLAFAVFSTFAGLAFAALTSDPFRCLPLGLVDACGGGSLASS